MRKPICHLRTLLRVAVFAGLCTACTDEPPCTEFSCRNGADLPIGAVTYGDAAALHGTTVIICHNDICASGMLPEPDSPVGYAGLMLQDDVHTTVGVGVMGFMGAVIVVGSFSGPKKLFHDGDRFTGVVISAEGTELLSGAWTANYIPNRPNGQACGPECDQAVMTADVAP